MARHLAVYLITHIRSSKKTILSQVDMLDKYQNTLNWPFTLQYYDVWISFLCIRHIKLSSIYIYNKHHHILLLLCIYNCSIARPCLTSKESVVHNTFMAKQGQLLCGDCTAIINKNCSVLDSTNKCEPAKLYTVTTKLNHSISQFLINFQVILIVFCFFGQNKETNLYVFYVFLDSILYIFLINRGFY